MEAKGLKVVHALPGRVRFRVARVKGNPALARRAQEKLARVPGIRKVEAQPDTGSLLVHYEMAELCSEEAMHVFSETLGEIFPEIEALSLTASLAQLALSPVSGTAGGLAAGLQGLNARVASLTGGADLKLLAPLFLIFLGFRGLLRSEKIAFPVWSDYLWFGFSSLILLNRHLLEGPPEHAPKEKAAGLPKDKVATGLKKLP